jgi:hypothetical protein
MPGRERALLMKWREASAIHIDWSEANTLPPEVIALDDADEDYNYYVITCFGRQEVGKQLPAQPA